MSSRNPPEVGSDSGRDLSSDSGRGRTISLLAVAGAIALVGAVLRSSCIGRSCERADGAESRVPFCSLPGGIREDIVAGFRDGRSPDLLAVTGEQVVTGGTAFGGAGHRPLWPSASAGASDEVPLAFSGTGVSAGMKIPEGTTLDTVAATLADIAGVRRPHPEVRSGTTIPGVASGRAPRLIVEVVWKGIGTRDLEDGDNEWPFLQSLMSTGSATLAARTGSQPMDPAAVLTTIGTGGRPSQHGITGTVLRNDEGRLVEAWGPDAPISVISTLPDDLDELEDGEPMIGLAATDRSDRGLVGGNWYTEGDRDEIAIGESASVREQMQAAVRLLGGGYGTDAITDVVGVVMEGDVDRLDEGLSRIAERAEEVSDSSVTIVVTATGSAAKGSGLGIDAAEVASRVEKTVSANGRVIEAIGPGGVYLDQGRLAQETISEDVVLDAMRSLRIGSAPLLFADAFPAIAVSFERYC